MLEVKGLSEAAAVELGSGYPEYGHDESEKPYEADTCNCCELSPDARDEDGSEHTLEERQHHTRHAGSAGEEGHVEETVVFFYDEGCAEGVHEFEDSGNEQHGADYYGADSFKSVHLRGL